MRGVASRGVWVAMLIAICIAFGLAIANFIRGGFVLGLFWLVLALIGLLAPGGRKD